MHAQKSTTSVHSSFFFGNYTNLEILALKAHIGQTKNVKSVKKASE